MIDLYVSTQNHIWGFLAYNCIYILMKSIVLCTRREAFDEDGMEAWPFNKRLTRFKVWYVMHIKVVMAVHFNIIYGNVDKDKCNY